MTHEICAAVVYSGDCDLSAGASCAADGDRGILRSAGPDSTVSLNLPAPAVSSVPPGRAAQAGSARTRLPGSPISLGLAPDGRGWPTLAVRHEWLAVRYSATNAHASNFCFHETFHSLSLKYRQKIYPSVIVAEFFPFAEPILYRTITLWLRPLAPRKLPPVSFCVSPGVYGRGEPREPGGEGRRLLYCRGAGFCTVNGIVLCRANCRRPPNVGGRAVGKTAGCW